MNATEWEIFLHTPNALVVSVGDGLGHFALHEIAILLKVVDRHMVSIDGHL